ncbi:putative wall-associated receptor kinase, galacturonan-binding domain-containing protein [Helianthus debilis subsp. tardiflorus]
MSPKLFVQVVVFVTLFLLRIRESQASLAKAGCQEMCGNISIPYPFGIGAGCYMHESFEVFCRGDHVPIWSANNQEYPILEFSTDLVRVIHEPVTSCAEFELIRVTQTLGQYFFLSQDHNLYVAVGCNIKAYFITYPINRSQVCESLCNERVPVGGSPANCTGYNGCCHLSIPKNVTSYEIMIQYNASGSACAQAFVSDISAPIYFEKRQRQFPLVLNWVVGLTTCHQARKNGDNLCGSNTYCVDLTNSLGYNCRCRKGYKGNPYLPNGCQGNFQVISFTL